MTPDDMEGRLLADAEDMAAQDAGILGISKRSRRLNDLASDLRALLLDYQERGRALDELTAESAALTKALTGLTCGGSEFFVRKGDRYVADIPACVGYVKRARDDAHRRWVEARATLKGKSHD